jgi:ankyrin repeat protein
LLVLNNKKRNNVGLFYLLNLTNYLIFTTRHAPMDNSSSKKHSQQTQEKLNAQLLQAAEKGYSTAVEGLIAQGANANTENLLGKTALILATEHGFITTVRTLIPHLNTADLNKKENVDGNTCKNSYLI